MSHCLQIHRLVTLWASANEHNKPRIVPQSRIGPQGGPPFEPAPLFECVVYLSPYLSPKIFVKYRSGTVGSSTLLFHPAEMCRV